MKRENLTGNLTKHATARGAFVYHRLLAKFRTRGHCQLAPLTRMVVTPWWNERAFVQYNSEVPRKERPLDLRPLQEILEITAENVSFSFGHGKPLKPKIPLLVSSYDIVQVYLFFLAALGAMMHQWRLGDDKVIKWFPSLNFFWMASGECLILWPGEWRHADLRPAFQTGLSPSPPWCIMWSLSHANRWNYLLLVDAKIVAQPSDDRRQMIRRNQTTNDNHQSATRDLALQFRVSVCYRYSIKRRKKA